MSDPKPRLKTASVLLNYHAASGFRADCNFKSHADCPKPMDANATLVAAAREIARIAAIAGAGVEVRQAVADAVDAVHQDMAKSPLNKPQETTDD